MGRRRENDEDCARRRQSASFGLRPQVGVDVEESVAEMNAPPSLENLTRRLDFNHSDLNDIPAISCWDTNGASFLIPIFR